jgi:predicted RNase H-like HicB family nuclease
MHKCLIVIEKTKNNYVAYSPDLPGCVATGSTRKESETLMHKAIALHIKGMKEDTLPIAKSTSSAEYVTM